MSYKITYTNPSSSEQLPSAEQARAMVSFMEEFYATSDDPAAHEKYVASFTPDATLIMGSKVARGSEGTFLYPFFIFFSLLFLCMVCWSVEVSF